MFVFLFKTFFKVGFRIGILGEIPLVVTFKLPVSEISEIDDHKSVSRQNPLQIQNPERFGHLRFWTVVNKPFKEWRITECWQTERQEKFAASLDKL